MRFVTFIGALAIGCRIPFATSAAREEKSAQQKRNGEEPNQDNHDYDKRN